jgi:hypothetical protein
MILQRVFYGHLDKLFAPPRVHGLETLFIQMAWVPQHLLSAVSVTMILFVLSRSIALGASILRQGCFIGLLVRFNLWKFFMDRSGICICSPVPYMRHFLQTSRPVALD